MWSVILLEKGSDFEKHRCDSTCTSDFLRPFLVVVDNILDSPQYPNLLVSSYTCILLTDCRQNPHLVS